MKFQTIQNLFFFGFLGIATLLFLNLIGIYSYTIFWAIFLTIVFYPIYKYFLKITKHKKKISSILTVLIIISVIIVPISFTSYLFVKEIPEINKNLLKKDSLDKTLNNIPFKSEIDNILIKNDIDPEDLEDKIINSSKKALSSWAGSILSLWNNVITLILNFFIMLYLLYFSFKDGNKFLLKLSKILPLGDKTERRLYDKFSSIIRSIFKGTLIVAIIQGLMGGLLFVILGIQSIFIWTIIMIIAAMIPAIGLGLILVPFMIYSFIIGNSGIAFFTLVWLLIISTVDNILRPYLIGHETEIPDVFITISILAGLISFGVTGLVIGPVITGFFLTMWHLFEEKYQDSLDNNE